MKQAREIWPEMVIYQPGEKLSANRNSEPHRKQRYLKSPFEKGGFRGISGA
jgi:hypothetical protein